MSVTENLGKYLVVGVFAAGLFVGGWKLIAPASAPSSGGMADVMVPQLSAQAMSGRQAFEANCAACHGKNASGTDQGPPLVHDIYNPGHHADEAFFRAAGQGVRQHHWPYGNMPEQSQVSEKQVADIVRYVRELQEANGIFYRPHQM